MTLPRTLRYFTKAIKVNDYFPTVLKPSKHRVTNLQFRISSAKQITSFITTLQNHRTRSPLTFITCIVFPVRTRESVLHRTEPTAVHSENISKISLVYVLDNLNKHLAKHIYLVLFVVSLYGFLRTFVIDM